MMVEVCGCDGGGVDMMVEVCGCDGGGVWM